MSLTPSPFPPPTHSLITKLMFVIKFAIAVHIIYICSLKEKVKATKK